jgi:Fur family zinc uptake transcriptional regulator
MEDEKISQLLDEKARALGFTPQAQTLEVHGLCANCSKTAKAAHVHG